MTMRFADRVLHLAPEGALHMLVRARALQAQGRDIIEFQIGQPDVPTYDNIAAAGWSLPSEALERLNAVSALPDRLLRRGPRVAASEPLCYTLVRKKTHITSDRAHLSHIGSRRPVWNNKSPNPRLL